MGQKPPLRRVDFSGLLRPPQVVAAFVERLIKDVNWVERENEFDPKREKRLHKRYLVPLRVDVQPIDEHFRPQGETYPVIAYDISVQGICIRDTRSVETKFLALNLVSPTGDEMQMLMEVLRCRHTGRLYDIGGKFISYACSE